MVSLNTDLVSDQFWPPSGKALSGTVFAAEGPAVRFSSAASALSFLFKGCGLWTLSLWLNLAPHNYEALTKWLLPLPTLKQEVVLVVTVYTAFFVLVLLCPLLEIRVALPG